MKPPSYGICLYKVEKDSIKILLCKSSISRIKWGFVKGHAQISEPAKTAAVREFFEESTISIDESDLEDGFKQINENKDVYIWLVNADNILSLDSKFDGNKLKEENLCFENDQIRFYDTRSLPPLKRNQKFMIREIAKFLEEKFSIDS
jgi:ADP-ribose pyrophosphatase YjhB (NUDIX family)